MDHPLTDHDRLRAGISEGLVNYGVKLRPEESSAFTELRIEGLIDYESFLKKTENEDLTGKQYGVVADISLVASVPNGIIKLSDWVRDPRAIMLSGGKMRAEAYAKRLRENNVKNLWISLDTEKGKEDRGRLVFVEGNNDFGLIGNYIINNDGRVVGVAPKAQVVSATQPSAIKEPPLEE